MLLRTALLALISLCLLPEAASAQCDELDFDGVDDVVTVPNTSGDFNFGSAITVEAWVNVTVAQAGGGFVGGVTSGGGGAWVLGAGISTPTDAVFSLSTPSTDAVFAPSAIQPGSWTHFAGSFDGTFLTIYVNGVLVGTSTHGSPGSASGVDHLVFGRFPAGNSLFFNGLVDEVRLWNVVRTPAEIAADWNQALVGNEPGLVGYYKFDEGSGIAVIDSSTGGNDGMLGALVTTGTDQPQRVVTSLPFNPCTGSSLGMNYCSAEVNSTGSAAAILATGSDMAAANMVTLRATSLPLNEFGIFITSPNQAFVPNAGGSSGNLCLAAPIGRYNTAAGYGVLNSGTTGDFNLLIDLTNTPTPTGPTAILAGSTVNFQAWFRDFIPGQGATSNFTDGVSVMFL